MVTRKSHSFIKLMITLLVVTASLFGIAVAGVVGIHNYQLNQMKKREVLWQTGLAVHLPIGVSLQNAKAFFVSYDSQLECITPSPVLLECAAHDPKKFGLLPEWHILFELEFVNEKLTKIQHRTLGVGL
jgi:hypothetical protein